MRMRGGSSEIRGIPFDDLLKHRDESREVAAEIARVV
jgi:hypothetical protein